MVLCQAEHCSGTGRPCPEVRRRQQRHARAAAGGAVSSRREALAALGLLPLAFDAVTLRAEALTVEDVTPALAPAGTLSPRCGQSPRVGCVCGAGDSRVG